MVESEGADAVELVNGEVFTSGPRVDPLPSAGAGQVELHDGARVRPRPVLVCGVQPVLRRPVRMPERPSVDATELPLGQRMGGGRGEGSRASRRSAGGKVGAEEGAGQATLTAIGGGAMILSTTGGAEPLGGGEKRRRVVNRGRVVLVGGRLRGAGGVGERKLLLRGRVGRTLLGCRWEVVWRLLSDGEERAGGASESAALGGGRKGGGELGSIGKLTRWLG